VLHLSSPKLHGNPQDANSFVAALTPQKILGVRALYTAMFSLVIIKLSAVLPNQNFCPTLL
jgi:hypothetical protein